MKFGESECDPTVAVAGRMKNESDVDWEQVILQVEFFNANGKLVDTDQALSYRYYWPSGEDIDFKVSFSRELAESVYATHKILVIFAKDSKASLWAG